MPDIVKICKIHGNLSRQNIRQVKGRKGAIIFRCFLCKKIMERNYYLNNKEKVLKYNLEYTRKKKDKIKLIRKKSREKNKLKNKVLKKLHDDKASRELKDYYIKKLMSRYGSLKYKDIPQELVIIKRCCLLIKRHIKEKNESSLFFKQKR